MDIKDLVQLGRFGQRFPRLAKSRFVHNVAVVASGTAAAQAITIAFSPVITRLYGPEAFGILGVFLAVVRIITLVASLGYEHAIVLPGSDTEAHALLRLSLLIGTGIAALSGAVFGAFHHQIGSVLGFGTGTGYLLLVPIVVLFAVLAQALHQWLIRMKRFRSIAGVEVIYAGSLGVSKSAFGLIAATAPLLLVLNTIGYALRATLLWLAARRSRIDRHEPSKPAHTLTEKAPLRRVAQTYRDFPFFRAPQFLLGSISQDIPILLLTALFDPTAAGFYALAVRVMKLPVILVSDSVGKVFRPRIAEAAHRGEKLRPLILRATGGLGLIGLLPFGVVIALGPWLFGFVFGAEWAMAGQYARWLALWLYLWFASIPCVEAIPILGLQAQGLAFTAAVSALRVGTLAFGAFVLESDIGAIALFSISSAFMDVVRNAWVIVRSRTCLRENFREGTEVGSSEEDRTR